MDAFVEDRSVLTRPGSPVDLVIRYGKLEENVADVRFGKSGADRQPLVVVIHGGFWRPQFDRAHTAPMCSAIAADGWTTASIEYRRVPGNPDAMLDDVSLALEKIPALVDRHDGRTVAIGHSAGGHLALWAAAKNPSSLVGAIALGPAADLQWGETHAIGNNAVREFLGTPVAHRRDIDPCQLPSPSAAIALIHGIEDAIAPIAMSENYVARHPKARLVRVADCGHFAVIDPQSDAWSTVLGEIERLSRT